MSRVREKENETGTILTDTHKVCILSEKKNKDFFFLLDNILALFFFHLVNNWNEYVPFFLKK